MPDLAAFILAGGKSTRMGRDKAFVEFEGHTLLARALGLARSLTNNTDASTEVKTDVRIVGEAAKFREFAPVVEDIFRGCGPLGGIHAALRASQAKFNLMLAVDVPFVSPEFLRWLIARARESQAMVTIVRIGERSQPLCAVYKPEFAGIAEMALRAGRYKIDALFETETTQWIGEADLSAAGFSVNMFRNLNTPEELAEAVGVPVRTPCEAVDDRKQTRGPSTA